MPMSQATSSTRSLGIKPILVDAALYVSARNWRQRNVDDNSLLFASLITKPDDAIANLYTSDTARP